MNFRITPPDVKYENGLLSVEKIDNSTIYYRDDVTGKVRKYRKAIRTDKPAKYVFWAEYRGAKSPEFAHSSHYKTIQPKVKLTSSIPENPKRGYGLVAKYAKQMNTQRTCHAGDWLLFEFEEPVVCRKVKFYAGYFASPSRLFPAGYIEISEDGINFERVAELNGVGHVELVNPRPFKAARIVATASYVGGSYIRIGSPEIYPKY